MEYVTAKTYQNCEQVSDPYDKDGKKYVKIKQICPRCGGLGIIASRVENGQIIPIPVAAGICFQCEGKKYFIKEVRLYTEAEFKSMEKNKEKAKERLAAEREQKMKEEYAHKKAVWLETNGFAEDGSSYIVTGETYSIKDQLKEAGFKYDPILKWHKADPAGYEDRAIKIDVNDYFEFSAWGEGHYLTEAKDKVEKLLAPTLPVSHSEWVGTIGEQLKDVKVKLTAKTGFYGRYGYTNVYTFEDQAGNEYTWFTSCLVDKEVGDEFKISGRIKSHDEYKGAKKTIMTRVKIGEVA